MLQAALCGALPTRVLGPSFNEARVNVTSGLDRQRLVERFGEDVYQKLLATNTSIEPVKRSLIIQKTLPVPLCLETEVPSELLPFYEPYKDLPKTREEAERIGKLSAGWNGDSVHLVRTSHDIDGTHFEVRMAPNRLLQAQKDAIAAGVELDWGVRQLHVGILALVMTPDGPALIGQLRSPWVDAGGTIHPCIAAGGLDPNSFLPPGTVVSEDNPAAPMSVAGNLERIQSASQGIFNPFAKTRGFELTEELLFDNRADFNPIALYLLHEHGVPNLLTGNRLGTALYCNLMHVARSSKGERIPFDHYMGHMQGYAESLAQRNIPPEKAEVSGWGLLYLDKTRLSADTAGNIYVHDVECFLPQSDGSLKRERRETMKGFSADVFAQFLQFSNPHGGLRQQILMTAGLPT